MIFNNNSTRGHTGSLLVLTKTREHCHCHHYTLGLHAPCVIQLIILSNIANDNVYLNII